MNLKMKFALGGVLALASAGAFAQTISLPSSGNGSAVLTLFSTDDSTPFSYTFNLGLTFTDLLNASYQTPGFTKSWSLTGLAGDLSGFTGTSNLVFDVTAAKQSGSIAVAGSFGLETTFDPSILLSTITALQSGSLQTAEQKNNAFLTNFGTTNPSFTKTTTDPNYANANYNAQLNTFAINAAASTSLALPFYELVSNKSTTSTIQTPLVYAGKWTINLATDTLTYTVPGSQVPLPAGVWLLASGLLGMFLMSRRRRSDDAAFGAMA
jgi:hypothetical protein